MHYCVILHFCWSKSLQPCCPNTSGVIHTGVVLMMMHRSLGKPTNQKHTESLSQTKCILSLGVVCSLKIRRQLRDSYTFHTTYIVVSHFDVSWFFLMLRIFILGELLDRHMQVFSTNSFFKGMTIPIPERMEPLKSKNQNISAQAMSFLEVRYWNLMSFACYPLRVEKNASSVFDNC